jgi:hypothetical protein
MPKSPLETDLGANKQATPVRISVYDNENNSERHWDEGRSSPFVSELVEDKENAHSHAMASRSTSGATEVIHRDFDDIGMEDAPPTETKHRTPFRIAEDETCTFHTTRSAVSRTTSPIKPALSRTSTQSSSGSLSVTTHSSYESKSSHRVISFGTEAGDFPPMEDANIDDTCFSTFSEVPNTDMTAFARLGQRSPTKQMLFDQVSNIFPTHLHAANKYSQRHDHEHSARQVRHGQESSAHLHPHLEAEPATFRSIRTVATPRICSSTLRNSSRPHL